MVLSKNVNGKLLRCGYTTGVCAAAAAKAAAVMLLSGKTVDRVDLTTPSGISLKLDILCIDRDQNNAVFCAVKKDAGDDPDVTDGTLIFARVEKSFTPHAHIPESRTSGDFHSGSSIAHDKILRNGQPYNKANEQPHNKTTGQPHNTAPQNGTLRSAQSDNGTSVSAAADQPNAGARIIIEGGQGVGRVTKPGLDQPVGAAAINSTPRRMITEQLEKICADFAYSGTLMVTISVPDGAALARRTFNPRMGIEGGISIIGTTGIVEPMSVKALADTVRLEIRQIASRGERNILLTPGNYGQAFASATLGLSLSSHVICSNFIGDAVDAAVETGFQNILLVGHIGKLVKLGIGMTCTHSSNGDGRMETLCACALLAGAKTPLLCGIMDSVTTDGALTLIREAGLLKKTMAVLGARIGDCLDRRVPETVNIGFVCFTNAEGFSGVLAGSENAETLINLWRKNV